MMAQVPATVDDTATCVGLRLNMDFQGSDLQVLPHVCRVFCFCLFLTLLLVTTDFVLEYTAEG